MELARQAQGRTGDDGSWRARDRRNQRRYLLVMLLWAIVLVASTMLLAFERVGGPLGRVVGALPAVAAVFVVMVYWRYVREADELARMIELHALAVAVSAGFVAWSFFRQFDLESSGISPTYLVMVAFYIVGTVRARYRYR